MFCTRARSCARADDAKIVRSRNAQCKTRELPRRLQRVFRCYIVYETMEDYKEGCLMVWANYVSLQLHC